MVHQESPARPSRDSWTLTQLADDLCFTQEHVREILLDPELQLSFPQNLDDYSFSRGDVDAIMNLVEARYLPTWQQPGAFLNEEERTALLAEPDNLINLIED